MSSPRLICTFEPELVRRLSGRTLVLRVPEPAQVRAAAEAARAAGAGLERLLVRLPGTLAAFEPDPAWRGLPLGLEARSMGPFRDLVAKLEGLRALAPVVYLPARDPANLRDARILASVGVATSLVLDRDGADWEPLTDLLTYAVLERVPHAPIEPFATVALRYQPDAYTPWGALVFDDPAEYLHLDAAGRVAASAADLAAGRFVADSIEALGDPAANPALEEARQAWRKHFLDDDACARCPGFRVCMGRFAPVAGPEPGCAAAFAELMDVIELRRRQPPPGATPRPG